MHAQRGDFLIVEPDNSNSAAEAGGKDSKVTGTIVHILFPDQVAHLRKLPCWPEGFSKESKKSEEATLDASRRGGGGGGGDEKVDGVAAAGAGEGVEAVAGAGVGVEGRVEGSDSESEDDDDDLFVNNNRNHDDLINSDSDGD